MDRKIEIKEMPAQPILGKRFRTSMEKVPEDVGGGYGALFAYMGEMGEYPSGPPFALYFGLPDFDPNDFEMEVCVPVNRSVQGEGEIVFRELAGGLMAFTVHKGPYSDMPAAYQDLDQWIKENGYQYAGPAREVYLNDPGQVDEAELLTEILIPIEKTE